MTQLKIILKSAGWTPRGNRWRRRQKRRPSTTLFSLSTGYDTHVGELGDTPLGGERQRIGGSGLLHDAPFLLLDEPTSNLDISEGIILRPSGRGAGAPSCWSPHRASTMAGVADTVYKMDSGRVSWMAKTADRKRQELEMIRLDGGASTAGGNHGNKARIYARVRGAVRLRCGAHRPLPHMETKTFCSPARPCYRPEMREQIRAVMRYAGPRMLFTTRSQPLNTSGGQTAKSRKRPPRRGRAQGAQFGEKVARPSLSFRRNFCPHLSEERGGVVRLGGGRTLHFSRKHAVIALFRAMSLVLLFFRIIRHIAEFPAGVAYLQAAAKRRR